MKTAGPATTSSNLANRGFDAAPDESRHGDGADIVVCLARGEVRAMAGAQTGDIRGVAGRAWVTQEGDAADVIGAAGDAFHAAPRGKIVVQALADDGAVLRVTRRGHAASTPRTPAARGRRR
jgi:hypothetical protein